MHSRYLSLFFLSLLAIGAARGDDQHRLTGNARTATVEISPQPAGRRLISLPELEFQVHVDATCPVNSYAESLSISIADTIETHDAATLNTEKSSEIAIDTTIQVVSGQLAPIPVERFCTSDSDESTSDGMTAAQELLFPEAFAASISLRCLTDNVQTVSYASLPLDIRLVCTLIQNPDTGTD